MGKFLTKTILFLSLLASMWSVIKCEQRLLSEIVDKFNGASQPPPDPKVVQKYLLDMFGIRPSSRNRAGTPPSHMLDLYEYFVSKEDEEETATRDHETDNPGMVIRSISPLPDYYRKNVLVFNISGLKSNEEEVFTAQLHLRRRRLPRRHHKRTRKTLDPPMHVRLLRVWPFASRRMSNIASYPVSSSEGGWRVVDVTAAVREDAATSSPKKLRYIGVRFEGPSYAEKRRSRSIATLSVEEFLVSKCDPQNAAYLVIFSKQTDEDKNEDYSDAIDVEAQYSKEVYSTGKENDIKVMLPDSIRMTVEPRTPKYDEEEAASRITNEIVQNDHGSAFPGNWVGRLGERQRSGRSLSDNELPGEELLGTYEDDVLNIEEELVRAIPAETNGMEIEGKDDEEMIPYSDVYYEAKEPVNPIWWSADLERKSRKDEAKRKRGRKNDNAEEMKRFGERKNGRKGTISPFRSSREKDMGIGKVGFGGRARKKEGRSGRKKIRGDICRDGMSAVESSDQRRILKGTVVLEEERSRKAFQGGRNWQKAKKGKMEDPWQTFGESIKEGKSTKHLKTKEKNLRVRKNDGRRVKGIQKDSGAVIVEDGLENGVTCSILNFTIDTNKLGWSSWLYGPRVFHSSYCSGNCETEIIKDFSFANLTKSGGVYDGERRRKERKTTKDGRLSNFASRSSFTRDKRSLCDDPKKTDKCCSPKLFAPVSVLYIDENEDIVLKSFPRMRVLRCGCA